LVEGNYRYTETITHIRWCYGSACANNKSRASREQAGKRPRDRLRGASGWIFQEVWRSDTPVISNAVVGALIPAKAALVLDQTSLARILEHYRRIVAVAVKTFFYGVASLLLGYLERFLEALRKVHSFGGAIQSVIDRANHYRLFAWALGISIVFALYFSFFEIGQRMGEGELWRLFFDSPRIANGSDSFPKVG